MRDEPRTASQSIWRYLELKLIILGISTFLFGLAVVIEAGTEHCNDCGWESRQALILLIGALGLWLSQTWSYIIAIIAGARVAYTVGYTNLWSFANIHTEGGSLLRPQTWVNWATFTLETQPQYLIESVLAVGIFAYAFHSLVARLKSKVRPATNGA